ncbi:MAG: DUF1553 domain-containing protein [Planctomycetia bacterium]|nr:DUF1553 domain-containing protein [Planctomycetia bacterium]
MGGRRMARPGHQRPRSPASGLTALACAWALVAQGAEPPADEAAFFATEVAPLLARRCLDCHSAAGEINGGLQLDLRAGWQQGGDSGPAIVAGKPGESLLVRAVRWEQNAPEMPPDGRLPAADVAILETWIKRGAFDPREGDPLPRDRGNRPRGTTGMTVEEGRQLWCLQPLEPPPVPTVDDPAWAYDPIDRFIHTAAAAAGIEPAPPAAPEVLVRRLWQDLTGLPPSPEEIDAFVVAHAADPRGAVERVVDRLLADPGFGERFGRHWLDLARFAESSGGGRTLLFKDAWRYRDWVIDAVNADMPFDRFLAAQLAGDLLPAAATAEREQLLAATGFLVLGPTNYEEQDKQQLRMDIVDEQLDTLGKVFLGQSLGCARCHDHAFEPITQADYHALAGILASTQTLFNETDNVARWIAVPLEEPADVATRRGAIDTEVAGIAREIKELKRATDTADAADRIKALEARQKALRAELPPRPTVMTVRDREAPADTALRIRGIEKNRGAVVARGLPAVFGTALAIPPGTSGRRELAAWLGDPAHPLVPRVLANRVWHWLTGRGIVATVDAFGATGAAPSHPALLDHLASRLVADGYRLKPLVRAIVLSRTYAAAVAAPDPADPDNALFTRARRRRLDAEQIRDAILAAAGTLDRTAGGLSIVGAGEIDANDTAAQAIEYGYVFADTRRSVYTPAFRNRRPTLFEVFDFADINTATGARPASTVATQALFFANDPFAVTQARATAARVLAALPDGEGEPADARRVEWLHRTLLGRPPRSGEMARCLEFLRAAGGTAEAHAVLVQALFGSIDFRFLD